MRWAGESHDQGGVQVRYSLERKYWSATGRRGMMLRQRKKMLRHLWGYFPSRVVTRTLVCPGLPWGWHTEELRPAAAWPMATAEQGNGSRQSSSELHWVPGC